MPPKRPWNARAATSCGIVCANPHTAEVARKPTMPTWRKRLRPKRSPSLPEIGMTVVEVTRYAAVTQA